MAIFNSFFYVYQRVRHPARSPSSMRCSVPQFCKGKLAFLHRQRLRRSGSAYAHIIHIYIYLYIWYIHYTIIMIKMMIIIIYYYSIAFLYTITINVYIYMCIIVYIYISPQGLWTELAQSCFRTSGIIPAKLVGGFNQPLLKILVSWDYYSQLNGKIKNVPNHQREKISTIGPSSSGMQVLWSSALPNWNPWDLQVLFCRNWKVKQLRGLHKETHEGCINHATTWWIRRSWLVGGIPTPLKNMSSSVGMMKFPTKWKNKSCSKPHIWKNPDNFRCKLDSVHLVEPRTVSLPTPKGIVFVVPDFVVGKHQLVDVLQLLLFYIYILCWYVYILYIIYI